MHAPSDEKSQEVKDLLDKISYLETLNANIQAEYESKLKQLEESVKTLTEEGAHMKTAQCQAEEYINKLTGDLSELKELHTRQSSELDESLNEANKLKEICRDYEANLSSETERLENLVNLKQVTIDRLNEEIDSMNERLESEKLNHYRLNEAYTDTLRSKETISYELDDLKRSFEQKDQTIAEYEQKVSFFAEKQQNADFLLDELNELKVKTENQRLDYEDRLNKLMAELKDKESRFAELTAIKEENSASIVKSSSFDVDLNESNLNVSLTSETPKQSMSVSSNKCCSHLEAQLKYCHEKCEKVVLKLNQLKKQNENLNMKIKSIKSMAFI